jgi:hypothetical protein
VCRHGLERGALGVMCEWPQQPFGNDISGKRALAPGGGSVVVGWAGRAFDDRPMVGRDLIGAWRAPPSPPPLVPCSNSPAVLLPPDSGRRGGTPRGEPRGLRGGAAAPLSRLSGPCQRRAGRQATVLRRACMPCTLPMPSPHTSPPSSCCRHGSVSLLPVATAATWVRYVHNVCTVRAEVLRQTSAHRQRVIPVPVLDPWPRLPCAARGPASRLGQGVPVPSLSPQPHTHTLLPTIPPPRK